MGASEGFQSLCGYSSDPVFPLFSLQSRVLRDRFEFEYRSDHLSSCRLSLCFSFDEFLSLGLSFSFLGSAHLFTLSSLLDTLGYVH